MIEATKRRVSEKADICLMDLESKFSFEDNSFDFILRSLTLHYIKDWDITFSELKRMLKPSEIFLYSVHHPFSDIELLEDLSYYSAELIIDNWDKEGKLFTVPFFRRPLQSILNKTIQYFSIEKVIEPQPTLRFRELDPEKYEKLQKKPQFLIIKAKKH